VLLHRIPGLEYLKKPIEARNKKVEITAVGIAAKEIVAPGQFTNAFMNQQLFIQVWITTADI
jgi:hypothetical protein